MAASTTSNIAFGNAYKSVQANNINGSIHIGLENIFDRLPRAEDAPFNSYAKQHEPTCLPDTRVDLLQEIYSWADGQDERCIFWLSGWQAQASRRSRDGGAQLLRQAASGSQLLLLARRRRRRRPRSDAVVERDMLASLCVTSGSTLFLCPLSKLHEPEAGLEVPIRHGFQTIADSEHKDVILHNISPSIVDHDIGLFLEYHLRIIAGECCQADDWPGVETIRRLVQSACGLFIWAATACRFVREGGQFVTSRLRAVLKDSSSIDSSSANNSSCSDSAQTSTSRFCPNSG
ncbi:hypothetical protein KJE20_14256 [Pyrenophora tritici-repentis]|nr:hypothetical protein KJE20_14256 [Pyrenophora tritici-repentis]